MGNNLEEGLVGKPKSKRIFYLDALRALAILSVIILHVAAMDGLVTMLGISTKSYPLTVFLIFVLSTFLSWAVIEILSYVPGLGKAIGSK